LTIDQQMIVDLRRMLGRVGMAPADRSGSNIGRPSNDT
jgi:hypothetical protein